MFDVYISPSDQRGNTYAAGDTNEEAQCERIAAAVESAAKRCGINAFANLKDDMKTKVADANKQGTRLYLCIHTNAFNELVSGTRIFCHSFAGEGYKAAVCVFEELAPVTPGTSENIKEYPTLYEVRNTNAPCVYVEVDFHDVDEVALWIIDHTEEIAEAIVRGLCKYYGKAYVPAVAVLPDGGDVVLREDVANAMTGKTTITITEAEETKEEKEMLPALKKGSKGDSVKALQKMLEATGFPCGAAGVDGDFGNGTDSALRAFQTEYSLTSDGVAGAKTWPVLVAAPNKAGDAKLQTELTGVRTSADMLCARVEEAVKIFREGKGE